MFLSAFNMTESPRITLLVVSWVGQLHRVGKSCAKLAEHLDPSVHSKWGCIGRADTKSLHSWHTSGQVPCRWEGKRERERFPLHLSAFLKLSLDPLRDDVFRVFAGSSDLCLTAAEAEGPKDYFFFLFQYWPSNSNGMADTAVLLGFKASIFSFFPNTHTHTLTVSFNNREADIISYPVVFLSLFQDHRTRVSN